MEVRTRVKIERWKLGLGGAAHPRAPRAVDAVGGDLGWAYRLTGSTPCPGHVQSNALRGDTTDAHLWVGLATAYEALGEPRPADRDARGRRSLPRRRDLPLRLPTRIRANKDPAKWRAAVLERLTVTPGPDDRPAARKRLLNAYLWKGDYEARGSRCSASWWRFSPRPTPGSWASWPLAARSLNRQQEAATVLGRFLMRRKRPDDPEGASGWLAQTCDSRSGRGIARSSTVEGAGARSPWATARGPRPPRLPAPAARGEGGGDQRCSGASSAADPRGDEGIPPPAGGAPTRGAGDGPARSARSGAWPGSVRRDHDTLALLGPRSCSSSRPRALRLDRRVRAGGGDRAGPVSDSALALARRSTSGERPRARAGPCSSAWREARARGSRAAGAGGRARPGTEDGGSALSRWTGSPPSRPRMSATRSRPWTPSPPRIACPRRSRGSGESSSRIWARPAPRSGSPSSMSGTTRSARPSLSTRGLDRAGTLAGRLARAARRGSTDFQDRPADFVRVAERLLARRPDDWASATRPPRPPRALGRFPDSVRLMQPMVAAAALEGGPGAPVPEPHRAGRPPGRRARAHRRRVRGEPPPTGRRRAAS